MTIILLLVGLGLIVLGADWLVDGASAIARKAGVSDKFIAITILAGGTSFPELVTCIVAAAKHKDQLVRGNEPRGCRDSHCQLRVAAALGIFRAERSIPERILPYLLSFPKKG